MHFIIFRFITVQCVQISCHSFRLSKVTDLILCIGSTALKLVQLAPQVRALRRPRSTSRWPSSGQHLCFRFFIKSYKQTSFSKDDRKLEQMERDGPFIDLKLNLQQEQQHRFPPAPQKDPIFQPSAINCIMCPPPPKPTRAARLIDSGAYRLLSSSLLRPPRGGRV